MRRTSAIRQLPLFAGGHNSHSTKIWMVAGIRNTVLWRRAVTCESWNVIRLEHKHSPVVTKKGYFVHQSKTKMSALCKRRAHTMHWRIEFVCRKRTAIHSHRAYRSVQCSVQCVRCSSTNRSRVFFTNCRFQLLSYVPLAIFGFVIVICAVAICIARPDKV